MEKGGWGRSPIRDYITWGCLSKKKKLVSLIKYSLYKTLAYSVNSNIIYSTKLSGVKHFTITL